MVGCHRNGRLTAHQEWDRYESPTKTCAHAFLVSICARSQLGSALPSIASNHPAQQKRQRAPRNVLRWDVLAIALFPELHIAANKTDPCHSSRAANTRGKARRIAHRYGECYACSPSGDLTFR